LDNSASNQGEEAIPVSEKYLSEKNGQTDEIVSQNNTISISSIEKGDVGA